MRRTMRRLGTGEGPLSPFSSVMWTTVIEASIWVLAVLTSRNAFGVDPDAVPTAWTIAWAWILAAVSLAFYLYKFLENVSMLFWPGQWWVIKTLSYRQLRRLLGKSASGAVGEEDDAASPPQSPISYLDALDLYTAFAFALSLTINAVYESDVSSYTGVPSPALSIQRISRFWALTLFLQNGVGFSGLLSSRFYSDVVAALVAYFGGLVGWSVVGVVVSVLVSGDPMADLLEMLRRKKHRRKRRDA